MNDDEKLIINSVKIENFVKNELLAEQKYKRENDAKLRAVGQRVPTYEDFRQMVLASHLKPLDKGETLRGHVSRENNSKSWNAVMIGNTSSRDTANIDTTKADLEKANLIHDEPKSSLEFIKLWHLLDSKYGGDENECNEMKWAFLNALKLEKVLKLFHAEINGEMLGKFLILFEKRLKNRENDMLVSDTNFVVGLLKVFVKCNRFNLNLMFLKTNELEACRNVFKTLEEMLIIENDLKRDYLK